MKSKLTDLTVAKLPFTGKQYTVFDTELRCFGVRVYRGKTFILKQHNKYHTLGRYPQCSLKQCRDEAKRRLALKYFPDTSKQAPDAAKWYLESIKSEKRPATFRVYETYLERIPAKPLDQLTPQILYAALPAKKSAANLCFSIFKAFLSWCVERGHLTTHPLLKRKQPNKLKSRDRLLTDEEVRFIWQESYNHSSFGALIRLLLLTGQRLSQIQSLHLSWLSTADTILFPPYIMKNGQEHVIPLTYYLQQHLNTLNTQPFNNNTYIWGDKPLTNISESMKKFRETLPQVQHFRLHDFRRYLSSTCARLGIKQEVVERVLAHRTGKVSGVAAVYNRYSYEEEIRQAFLLYHQHLSQICEDPRLTEPT